MTRRDLVAKRRNMGLSVEAAAAEIGIARNTLARFERGDTLILSTLKLIADFYGCQVTDLAAAPTEDVAA